MNQRLPIGLEGQFKQHAYYAIVVILDLRNQLLPAGQQDRLELLDNGRIFEPNVVRRGMFEAGLDPPSAQDLAQLFKPDLLADVVEDDSQDTALHGRSGVGGSEAQS